MRYYYDTDDNGTLYTAATTAEREEAKEAGLQRISRKAAFAKAKEAEMPIYTITDRRLICRRCGNETSNAARYCPACKKPLFQN